MSCTRCGNYLYSCRFCKYEDIYCHNCGRCLNTNCGHYFNIYYNNQCNQSNTIYNIIDIIDSEDLYNTALLYEKSNIEIMYKYLLLAFKNGCKQSEQKLGSLVNNIDEILDHYRELYKKKIKMDHLQNKTEGFDDIKSIIYNLACIYDKHVKKSMADYYYNILANTGDINYAKIFENIGKLDMACVCYEINGDSSFIDKLIELYIKLGNMVKLEHYYKKKSKSNNVDDIYILAEFYEKNGKNDMAKKYYHKSAKLGDSKSMYKIMFKYKDTCDKNICTVCMDKPRDYIFINCGHMCICGDCAPKLAKCTICQLPGKAIKVYNN